MQEFNKKNLTKRVLVAPLDWGLGHATRCIPLINELILQGCTVLIAAEGNVKVLLQKEFPNCTFLPLDGYNIKYAPKKWLMPLYILGQVPSILFSICKEHFWLKRIIKEHSIDLVISDNRFGLFTQKVTSVFITHQLLIKTGNRFIETVLKQINYFFINRFTICWIPDFSGKDNIAGELSHPTQLPANAKYIGSLSRFVYSNSVKKKYAITFLLSGPEPQRTILENIILKEMEKNSDCTLLVRGLPNSNEQINPNNPTSTVVNHLTAKELNEAILASEWIVARSGYTTVMDLVQLKKNALLIPTPGQTEQEYLAKYLQDKQLFLSIEQQHFSLEAIRRNDTTTKMNDLNFDTDLYKVAIKNVLSL